MKSIFKFLWPNMVLALVFITIACIYLGMGESVSFFTNMLVAFFNIAIVIIVSVGMVLDEIEDLKNKLNEKK